jgi:hypothetical protein
LKPPKDKAPFDRPFAIKAGLTVLLLATVLTLSLNWSFYYESMVNAYLSLALAGALIVLAILRRSWFDLLWVVTGALILAALDLRVMEYKPFFMGGFGFLGMSALAVLGTHTIWAKPEERKLLLYGFLPSVLFVASEWMASTLLDVTETLHPKTFDVFLYSFDSSLRVQISFLTGQFLLNHLSLRTASLAIYIGLPLPLALVYASSIAAQERAGARGDGGISSYRAFGSHVLQRAAGMWSCPLVRAGVSLESALDRRRDASQRRSDTDEGRPERDSFPPHDVGSIGVVEFEGSGALGAGHRRPVRRADRSGHAGDRRALFHRSSGGVPVFSDGAVALLLLSAVPGGAAAQRVPVWHVRDVDLAGPA